MSDKTPRTDVLSCRNKSGSATWLEIATEFAQETIENGPSAYISPETAEAVAQVMLALIAKLAVCRAELERTQGELAKAWSAAVRYTGISAGVVPSPAGPDALAEELWQDYVAACLTQSAKKSFIEIIERLRSRPADRDAGPTIIEGPLPGEAVERARLAGDYSAVPGLVDPPKPSKKPLEERLQLAAHACKVAHLLGPQAAIVDALAALRAKEPFADKYHELLLAVGNKYPGESRHETALRYIRNAERPQPGDDAAMSQQEPMGESK